MKQHNLLCKTKRYKAKRKISNRNKPRANRPRQFWGIDMTKIMISGFGWVYLVVILDWYSRKVVGWSLDIRSRSKEWINVLEEAVLKEFPNGVRDAGLNLISDNGSQVTSRSFMDRCKILDINQIFTSYNNPKGNAETERFIRTLKEEVIWPLEFDNLEEARTCIGEWIRYYNSEYVHSSLGYMSPLEYEEAYFSNISKGIKVA